MEKEKRKISGFIYIIVAILMIVSFILGFCVNCATTSKTAKKIDEVLDYIDKNSIYYDGDSLDAVVKSFVNTVIKEDNYAKYYTKEEKQSQDSLDDGNYGGTGLAFFVDKNGNILNDYCIHKVINNSPADKAGIKSGDIILGVKTTESQYNTFINNEELLTYLSQIDYQTEITFNLFRTGEFLSKEFKIKKANYIASMVTYYDSECKYCFLYEDEEVKATTLNGKGMAELDSDTAYIEFSEFSGNASEEFAKAMQFFTARGKSKLILDLRDNGGGFMNILVDVSSYLIKASGKKPIVNVKEKDSEYSFYKTGDNFPQALQQTVVIADSNTASASECLIGAMMNYNTIDYDHLILTDYNSDRNNYSTFGKGIMQTTYNLSNGDALKITTAKIYWPDGETSIHDKGIVQSKTENCTADKLAIKRAIDILK